MSTRFPACWSQQADSYEDDYSRSQCEADGLSAVPATLLICLCGLVGNGAVLWLLGPRVCRNPIAIYVLNLAVADFTFLFSVTVALMIFYGPRSFCHRLGSRNAMAALNIAIIFAFTASTYLLATLSARTSLPALPRSRCPCHRSWHCPVLLCALLWLLALLLTLTLPFSPVVLVIFVLSYLLSVLILILSALTLFAKILCCSWQYPPRKLCVVVLVIVVSFPLFTADFSYWLLLRLFDFSVLVFDTSLLFACMNSCIKPVIYLLAGSCTMKFTVSVRAACQSAFEDITEPENRDGTPRESTVETDV